MDTRCQMLPTSYTGSTTLAIFSSIDIRSGYYHVQVDQRDRHKTAFAVRNGHYQWKRMAFGFKNAPMCFQRAMDKIFRSARYASCLVVETKRII